MMIFKQTFRYNLYLNGYKNVLQVRSNWLWLDSVQIQTCTPEYTKKSAEEKLGIMKPKRPLNPFFTYMQQIRPALLAQIPGISNKEAVVWSSKHWQQLDSKTKLEMGKKYKKDLEKHQIIKAKYEASLTEQQKEDIKRTNAEMVSAREKLKLKMELKEMGKPKKPMSSYLLYAQSRIDLFQSNHLKEYQEKIRPDWLKLPESEREKYEEQAQNLMKKYKKDMNSWELKMITIGRSHLVRRKPQKQIKTKDDKSR